MLLILGLSSYESITGERQYLGLMSRQRMALADELGEANFHLRDDYPDECYPADMLWAVAAIQRAARLDNGPPRRTGQRADGRIRRPVKAAGGPASLSGRPPLGADSSRRARLRKPVIIFFAAELDPAVAGRWYVPTKGLLEKHRLDRRLHGNAAEPDAPFKEVDSGPVLFQMLGVPFFGIGAAKTAGRIDDAVPLTMEVVARFVADAFRFPAPRPDGPSGSKELESGRSGSAVLDDPADAGGPASSRSQATCRRWCGCCSPSMWA